MVEISAFRVVMRTRLNSEHYSPLKPTKVGFVFIGPNTLSRAVELSITWHKLLSELGLKVGFKDLQLEPKFLNRGLRSHKYHINNIGHVATAPGP